MTKLKVFTLVNDIKMDRYFQSQKDIAKWIENVLMDTKVYRLLVIGTNNEIYIDWKKEEK